jgi:hypothetical protein
VVAPTECHALGSLSNASFGLIKARCALNQGCLNSSLNVL